MSSPSSSKLGAAKIGALGLGAVALGCAALAAFLVSEMLSAKGFTGKKVVGVVVAPSDLAAATPLRPTDFEVRDWPEDSAPVGSYDTVEALFADNKAPTLSVG